MIAHVTGWSIAEIEAMSWDEFIAETIECRRFEGLD